MVRSQLSETLLEGAQRLRFRGLRLKACRGLGFRGFGLWGLGFSMVENF